MRLLLFDIDGTLLISRGAGRRAVKLALEQIYGTVGAIDHYDLGGKTDQRIVFDVLEAAGFARERVKERLDDFFETYARGLVDEIGDGQNVVTLPGVAALVQRLGETSDVLLGLLTGNIEEGARIKLGPTGLWPSFSVGAFGSDDVDRRRLPSLAARRAHAVAGYPFRPDEVVVIGDTPLDIDCARAFGAVAVAVATGNHTRTQLLEHEPDLLFDDFSDVDRVAAALVSARHARPGA
ncbi:MAG TPA: HAD hydrolase-like protein [Candidatus Methylomirabilis sp.]|nr:HAD hydrolase-like protein [Candidatus Methylomirabilis sp.]